MKLERISGLNDTTTPYTGTCWHCEKELTDRDVYDAGLWLGGGSVACEACREALYPRFTVEFRECEALCVEDRTEKGTS